MKPRSRAPRMGRVGLVIVSVITIVTTAVTINSPSASTAMVVHYDRVQTEDILGTVPSLAKPETMVPETIVPDSLLPASPAPTGADDTSGSTETKVATVSKEIPSPPARRRPSIKLATLAPSLPVPSSSQGREPRKYTEIKPARSKSAAIQVKADNFEKLPDPKVESRNDRISIKGFDNAVDKTDTADSAAVEVISIADDINTDGIDKVSAESSSSIASVFTSIPTVYHPIQENYLVQDQPEVDTPEVDAYEWHEVVVKKRDTLSRIFDRLGLHTDDAYTVASLKDARALNMIQPGQKIRIAKSASSGESGLERLQQLRLGLNIFDTLVIERQDEGFSVRTESREPEIEYRTASAEINSSLIGAAKQAGIPAELIYDLAAIFGWKVDFAKNLHPGDSFSIIYEQLLLDDQVVGHGQIIAAEMTAGGKKLQAIRHTDEQGRVAYYSPEGEGMEGSFLRSPMKFARVTSKFSKGRLHPIHKIWKAHKGVDYGAPVNTPIRATGDGVVKMIGRNGGYGNVVVLRHGRNIETLYAHMNKFRKGLRKGSRVEQGEIIGYVGRTGWATGPHLHYEFRTNGKHRDPLTVELPGSPPIEDKYRPQFLANADKWVNRLEQQGRITLARNSQE